VTRGRFAALPGSRLQPARRFRSRRHKRRLERAAGATWLLGLLVAVVSWDVSFAPPSYGLDPSWWSAMYMAAHRGMDFGSQIVFTYGPLAFLREAWLSCRPWRRAGS
jgi:hypothetical protein